MKKTLFFIVSMLCVCAGAVQADSITVNLLGPEGYEVIGMSKNGKYAVLSNGSAGVLWDLINNNVISLGSDEVTTYVQAVSDDGVVAGEFAFTGIDEETSGTTVTGGVYNDGVFYPLLDEDGNYIQSTGYGISPDGRYVCGCIWLTSWKVAPALWNADGTMIRRLAVEAVQGMATAVNNDGVCSGWYYHTEDGGTTNRQACYWTADDEIVPLTEDLNDVSGMYTANGLSGNGQYVCASVGTPEDSEDYAAGTWRKGIVYDIYAQEIVRDVSSSNYQVLNDGSVMFNMYADTTGVPMTYIDNGSDSISIKDYIEEEYGSSLSSELDPHLMYAYFSEDRTVIVGTSYLADGSDMQCQAWISGISEFADVRSFTVQPLPMIADKVLLRWKEPLVNYDNVLHYAVYGRVSEDDEWQTIADVEADLSLAVVSLPEGEASEYIYYMMTAVYDEQESEGVTASVALADISAGFGEAPSDIAAYVYNYNDVALSWTPGLTDASANIAWHGKTFDNSFGSNTEMTFQAGAFYDAEVVGCYRDKYKMKGVQFYFNTSVDTLQIVIYEGDDIIIRQTIDQDELTECSFNTVVFDEDMDLPENNSLLVALRVVQTAAGAPLGLDAGPAVEGGDMLSEDDGVTWTTMRELSSNAYDCNFLVSMLLTDGTTPEAEAYVLYADGDTVATVGDTGEDSYEYIVRDVALGNRSYTVEALWSDDSSGSVSTSVLVADRTADRCPAPLITSSQISADSTSVTLAWEMPRQSEVTYSNWTYRGRGTTISNMTGWFQGVQYTAQKMHPYAGGVISQVNFYPKADCDYAIHIYEDDVEVGYMDVEDYTSYAMNRVFLDEPVEIKAGSEYLVVIEGFDVPEDTAFLGNDNANISGYNIYSEDGETFYTDTYDNGNYMIGIMVVCPGDNGDAGITYNVNATTHTSQSSAYDETETTVLAAGLDGYEYTADISGFTAPEVVLNVGAVYAAGESLSEDVCIVLDEEALCITNITADGGITFADGIIRFGQTADMVRIFTADGKTVAGADNVRMLDTGNLAPGIYVLKTVVAGAASSVRICIRR